LGGKKNFRKKVKSAAGYLFLTSFVL